MRDARPLTHEPINGDGARPHGRRTNAQNPATQRRSIAKGIDQVTREIALSYADLLRSLGIEGARAGGDAA